MSAAAISDPFQFGFSPVFPWLFGLPGVATTAGNTGLNVNSVSGPAGSTAGVTGTLQTTNQVGPATFDLNVVKSLSAAQTATISVVNAVDVGQWALVLPAIAGGTGDTGFIANAVSTPGGSSAGGTAFLVSDNQVGPITADLHVIKSISVAQTPTTSVVNAVDVGQWALVLPAIAGGTGDTGFIANAVSTPGGSSAGGTAFLVSDNQVGPITADLHVIKSISVAQTPTTSVVNAVDIGQWAFVLPGIAGGTGDIGWEATAISGPGAPTFTAFPVFASTVQIGPFIIDPSIGPGIGPRFAPASPVGPPPDPPSGGPKTAAALSTDTSDGTGGTPAGTGAGPSLAAPAVSTGSGSSSGASGGTSSGSSGGTGSGGSSGSSSGASGGTGSGSSGGTGSGSSGGTGSSGSSASSSGASGGTGSGGSSGSGSGASGGTGSGGSSGSSSGASGGTGSGSSGGTGSSGSSASTGSSK